MLVTPWKAFVDVSLAFFSCRLSQLFLVLFHRTLAVGGAPPPFIFLLLKLDPCNESEFVVVSV
jgi:hypothetical protein